MLRGLERIVVNEGPDAVLVFGDTNSTLAGALVAAKLGVPVAHVEAGLRSFDRRMPEELNRIVADHLSSWLFAPTEAAVRNLAREGLTDGVTLVGDVMQDLAARVSAEVRDPASLEAVATAIGGPLKGRALPPGGYLFATVHRAENREPGAAERWVALLGRLGTPRRPVVLALHPGTRAVLDRSGLRLPADVVVIPPQGYRSSLALQLHAAAVITDSGGVQREAAWLTVPCLVLRMTTEWTEAVASSKGRMVLVGLDADQAEQALDRLAPSDRSPAIAAARIAALDLASGGAAARILGALDLPGR